MKVLVTGGGGFLGRRIVRKLIKRGFEVRILGRSPQEDLEEIGIEVLRGDIADPETVNRAASGVEAVFHVAAKAGVWGSWDSFYGPNVIGTENVLNACRLHGVSRLVYTSTPSVVFNGTPFLNADESLPYGENWLCAYAQTKSIAERKVLASHDLTSGFQTVALRPHLIWGPGDPHLIPRVVDRARKGRLRIVGEGSNRVDITHVENAAEAHLNAFDALEGNQAGGKAYFISQGEPVVLWEWINDLLARLQIDPVMKKISLRSAYRLGSVLELVWKTLRLGGEPPMTRFVAVELAKDHFFNISAAKRDLGYDPVVSIEDGLVELVEDMKV